MNYPIDLMLQSASNAQDIRALRLELKNIPQEHRHGYGKSIDCLESIIIDGLAYFDPGTYPFLPGDPIFADRA